MKGLYAAMTGLKGQQAYSPWHRTTVDVASKDGLKAQQTHNCGNIRLLMLRAKTG